jgi:hypothetical protein
VPAKPGFPIRQTSATHPTRMMCSIQAMAAYLAVVLTRLLTPTWQSCPSRLVNRKTTGLTRGDIQNSLMRADVRVEFSVVDLPPASAVSQKVLRRTRQGGAKAEKRKMPHGQDGGTRFHSVLRSFSPGRFGDERDRGRCRGTNHPATDRPQEPYHSPGVYPRRRCVPGQRGGTIGVVTGASRCRAW